MHFITFEVFVVLGVPYFFLAVPTVIQARVYRDRVARATRRSTDSEFLRSGEFRKLSDPGLVAAGEALAPQLARLRWMTLGLVLALIATELLAS
jgi:hypothetical protein